MRGLRLLCLLFTGLALSGCLPVTTQTPVGTTKPQTEDTELRGSWSAASQKKDEKGTAYFHFLPTKNESDGNNMTAVLIAPMTEGQKAEWSTYRVSPARLGKHRYLNAQILSSDGEAAKDAEKEPIIPVLYTIKKGVLTLYLMNEQKASDAITAGRIAGTIEEINGVKSGDVKLTADGAALDAFLATDEGAALFTEKVFVPFRRIP